MMKHGRWLTICWEDKFDELDTIEMNENNNDEGILFIKHPFADITLSDGFWNYLNNKFNLMFDMAEEEDIDAIKIPDIVKEIITFSHNKYNKSGIYEVKTGCQIEPEKKEIIEHIPFKELNDKINRICDFLLNAYRKQKNVTFIL